MNFEALIEIKSKKIALFWELQFLIFQRFAGNGDITTNNLSRWQQTLEQASPALIPAY